VIRSTPPQREKKARVRGNSLKNDPPNAKPLDGTPIAAARTRTPPTSLNTVAITPPHFNQQKAGQASIACPHGLLLNLWLDDTFADQGPRITGKLQGLVRRFPMT
jgi:hypothetical protein